MRVIALAPEGPRSRNHLCHEAMIAGLGQHGIVPLELQIGRDPWRASDVMILNGWRKPGRAHTPYIDAQLAIGGRVLVMDRGFVCRKSHWSVGWDGLNGRAEFCNADSPPDRWQAMRPRPRVARWRKRGGPVIVMGQVPSDAALAGVDIDAWVRDAIATLRRHTDRPIVFRPHPKAPSSSGPAGAEEHRGPIADALEGAWAVVTFNSTSAVDALLAGVPVFAEDEGSIAWPVANHDLSRIERPKRRSREQWLADLAYAQWTLDEIRAGDAWAHIRKGIR